MALALIAGHNVAQNTFLNDKGYVLGNSLAATALIALGRASGHSLDEMGLRPRLESADLRTAGAVATAAAVSIAIVALHPETRPLLLDERARDDSPGTSCQKVLIRFPLGTALFEEVAFRGALPRLLARSEMAGHLLSSALFTLWHVIPTARILNGSPFAGSTDKPYRAVAAGSLAAGMGGLVLSLKRRRTGGVAMPWLLHSIFNIITYLGGVLAWRMSRRGSESSSLRPT